MRWRQLLLVYLFAVGILAGSAYTMYVHYDFSHSPDTRSYLGVARGEFRGNSLTRRYRVLVPAAAAVVAWPLERIYAHIWPQRATTDWALRLAFYLVNTLLLAAAGLVIFRTCLLYGATPAAALFALVAVLTSRWAVYMAGLPLVDSLYVLVFALGFYAVRSGSRAALLTCLLLGPLAKESFVFLAPWLLIFGQRVLRWPWQLLTLAVAGALTYTVRQWIDAQAGTEAQASVQNAFTHLENITYSLHRLFSVKGAGEIFSIFGFFTLVPLLGLRGGWATVRSWLLPLSSASLWLGLVVIIHMLLSSELARMGYLFSPVFAVACSLILTRHPLFSWFNYSSSIRQQG